VVLFVGTSLTAGLGLDPAYAYPALLQARLDSAGLGLRVVNRGVSGETSAAALRRVPTLLTGDLRAVVLETGANDGLQGLDPDTTEANIAAIAALVRAHDPGVRLLLVGMEAPPNLGPRYTARFRAMFPRLAARTGAAFVPFLLAGVAGVDSLNQDDGIHPTRRGQQIVADNVWAVLGPLLGRGRP